MLLNDHDRIWVAYRYEHILTTTGWVGGGESTSALLQAAAKRFLDATEESKVRIWESCDSEYHSGHWQPDQEASGE